MDQNVVYSLNIKRLLDLGVRRNEQVYQDERRDEEVDRPRKERHVLDSIVSKQVNASKREDEKVIIVCEMGLWFPRSRDWMKSETSWPITCFRDDPTTRICLSFHRICTFPHTPLILPWSYHNLLSRLCIS